MYKSLKKLNQRSKNIKHLICFYYDINLKTAGRKIVLIHYLIFHLRTHKSGKNIFHDIDDKYHICIIILKSSNMCDGQ